MAACPRIARERISVALPDPDVPFFRGALLTLDAQGRRGQEPPTRGITFLTRGAAAGFRVPADHPLDAFPCTKNLLTIYGTLGLGKQFVMVSCPMA